MSVYSFSMTAIQPSFVLLSSLIFRLTMSSGTWALNLALGSCRLNQIHLSCILFGMKGIHKEVSRPQINASNRQHILPDISTLQPQSLGSNLNGHQGPHSGNLQLYSLVGTISWRELESSVIKSLNPTMPNSTWVVKPSTGWLQQENSHAVHHIVSPSAPVWSGKAPDWIRAFYFCFCHLWLLVSSPEEPICRQKAKLIKQADLTSSMHDIWSPYYASKFSTPSLFHFLSRPIPDKLWPGPSKKVGPPVIPEVVWQVLNVFSVKQTCRNLIFPWTHLGTVKDGKWNNYSLKISRLKVHIIKFRKSPQDLEQLLLANGAKEPM